MSSQESFSFDLYPGLDAELDAALNRNVANGNASPDAIAANGLGAVVAAQMPNRLPGTLGGNVPPEFTDTVQLAFDQASDLFGMDARNGSAPSIESGVFDDANWELLAKSYDTMQELGLEPEIIVCPTNFNAGFWKSIYGVLPNTKDGGLYINEAVEAAWDSLGSVSQEVRAWEVQVVAATAKPTLLNISHDMSKSENGSLARLAEVFADGLSIGGIQNMRDHYPTLPAYLTLQALRLKHGQSPIDGETSTWLRGSVNDGRGAPYAYWNPDDGQVNVNWVSPDGQSDYIGVRPR